MVYEITKYALKGKDLYTSKERPDLEMRESDGMKRFYYKADGMQCFSYNWEFTTTPKQGAYSTDDTYLPYFADVTEDIASYYNIKPKTYRNCQLMTEKHGSYLQFYHKRTKKVLRIAMNSNYYTPKDLVVSK